MRRLLWARGIFSGSYTEKMELEEMGAVYSRQENCTNDSVEQTWANYCSWARVHK